MRTLIRNARILTFDADAREYARGDLMIEGQSIAAIAETLAPPADCEIIEGDGHLVMPGLINAHLHSPGNLMRGLLDGLPLEIFMLYEVPPLATNVEPGRLSYLRTLLGAAEMLQQGVTTVMDDAFHVPIATMEGIDAICKGYLDAGMRARIAIDQPNIVEYDKYPFLKDLLPADIRHEMELAPRQSQEELLELYRHLMHVWDGAADGRIGAALSCSAPQRVTVPYLHALSELARTHQVPFNIHILETKLQRVLGEERYGRSLVRYADDEGAIGPSTVVIHAIWVDQTDIEILANRRAAIAHNPVCNLRLGSGIGPFRRWRDAGIPVAIGTDEAIADDSISVWGAMKMAGLIHTLADADWRQWPTAREILDATLCGGARALSLENRIGTLTPGAFADLIIIDLDTLAFTPLNDLTRQLVYCENGSSVRHVFVAGRQVVRQGRITTFDERAVLREIRDIYRHASGSGPAAQAQRLEPYYRAMVLKAHARNVGMRQRLDG
jgi:5-methylthioadenosine/S-adenosylhomocysteine deaminase